MVYYLDNICENSYILDRKMWGKKVNDVGNGRSFHARLSGLYYLCIINSNYVAVIFTLLR